MRIKITSLLKNTKNKTHNIEHVSSILEHSEKLISEEQIEVDEKLLKDVVVWHDAGKAKFGNNILTALLDGPLSAILYLLSTRNKEFNFRVFKVIWKHSRHLYFLGTKMDRLLYKAESSEEKILFDLDLLELVNPIRTISMNKWVVEARFKSIDNDLFYFNYSRDKFNKYRNYRS